MSSTCCNPFSIENHNKHVRDLRPVTDTVISQSKTLKHDGFINIRLKTGMFICESCRKRISRTFHGEGEASTAPKRTKTSTGDTSDEASFHEMVNISPLQRNIIDAVDVKTKVNELLRAMNLDVIDESKFRSKSYRSGIHKYTTYCHE